MQEITIHLLRQKPQYKSTVANWLFKEFARPNETLSFFESLVENGICGQDLPCFFVAETSTHIPVGTVALCRADLLTRQDIAPWLALLYVDPKFRNHKIGTQLQNALLLYAKQKGFSQVYLYTTLINYYEKNNWHPIGSGIECDGTVVKLYQKETET